MYSLIFCVYVIVDRLVGIAPGLGRRQLGRGRLAHLPGLVGQQEGRRRRQTETHDETLQRLTSHGHLNARRIVRDNGPRGLALLAPRPDHGDRMLRLFVTVFVVLAAAAPARAQDSKPPSDQTALAQPSADDALTGWRKALRDSLVLTTLEHAVRIALQADTRRELEGPFFADYVRALHMPSAWADNNPWVVNYVGHPIHGAAAGYLWRDAAGPVSSDGLGMSAGYWKRIGTSGVWIAAFSLQFEFGPLSEASIGNVGMDPNQRGWVDHVMTPLGGMGMMVAEDAMDKYVLRWFESRTANHALRATLRILLNPGRSLANLAQGEYPWHRADRVP